MSDSQAEYWVFSSPYAVHLLFSLLIREASQNFLVPKLACTGQKSAQLLKGFGYSVSLCPEQAGFRNLAPLFDPEDQKAKVHCWLGEPNQASEFCSKLTGRGFELSSTIIYQQKELAQINWQPWEKFLAQKKPNKALCFGSSEQASIFLKRLKQERNQALSEELVLIALGQKCAALLQQLQPNNPIIIPEELSLNGVARALYAKYPHQNSR